MKLATLRSGQVAALTHGQLRAVSLAGSANGKASMIDVITRHHESGPDGLVLADDRQAVTEGDLAPPIGSPSKIWAAASNYDRGTSNPNEQTGAGRRAGTDQGRDPRADLHEASLGHRGAG